MPMKSREETIDIHGYALKEIRVREGRKVAELATELGVDRSYIARIEVGLSRRVSRVFFYALCSTLNITDPRSLYATAPARDKAAA